MVYVHNNPQGLNFNAVLYVFLRYWYTPELPNHKFIGDTWFKVPAIKVETPNSVNYTIINSKMEFTSMMMLSDSGRLLRANRVNMDQKVPAHHLVQIASEAFDIPQWEKINQQAFPYHTMFDGVKVNQRYKQLNGENTTAYFSTDSANPLFTEVKKAVSPRPCNCGKATYIS